MLRYGIPNLDKLEVNSPLQRRTAPLPMRRCGRAPKTARVLSAWPLQLAGGGLGAARLPVRGGQQPTGAQYGLPVEVPCGDAGHSEVSSSQLSAVRRALGNRATPQATMMNPCENVRTGNIITCDDGRKAEPIFTRTFRRFHFRLVHACYLGH